MKNRILVDSCVLVSASVFVSSKDVDDKAPIQHRFYEECKELFSFIEDNLARRIGIVTSTIENEAIGVLDKVIEGELKGKGYSRSENFEIFSKVFNICDIKMRNLISLLQREPTNPADVAQRIILIQKMYVEFKEKAKNLPKTADARARWVARRYQRTVDWHKIFRTQEQMTHSQTLNLLHKDVEFSDMTILAEAYHLYITYIETEGKGGNLYIASKDKHFVPVRRKGWMYEGREITDAIKERFGVICEHPRRIKDLLAMSKTMKK
jgi:hypothetical protein